VHPLSLRSAAELIVARARSGDPGACVCLTNVHSTVESRKLSSLRRAAEDAFLSVPDGMPLVWILRRRGYGSVEKVTGAELLPTVARAGLQHGLRHALFGGAPGVADRAAGNLVRAVPGVQIVAALEPPFGDVATLLRDDVLAQLRASRADVLWVGLGAPKQEVWMARAAPLLGISVLVGIGAAFDFVAGTKRRAPRFMRNTGLEWLHRLGSEPRRLWRRYLVGNAIFLALLARERLHRGGSR